MRFIFVSAIDPVGRDLQNSPRSISEGESDSGVDATAVQRLYFGQLRRVTRPILGHAAEHLPRDVLVLWHDAIIFTRLSPIDNTGATEIEGESH
jgi:hypothetical protein